MSNVTQSTTFVVIIFVIFIAIAAFSLWLTYKRYTLVGEALKEHNTGLAIALSSPEIGQGIGAAFGRR